MVASGIVTWICTGVLLTKPAEAGGEVALQGVRERVVQSLPASARQAVGQHPVVLEGLTERSPHVLRLRRTCLAGVGPRGGVVGVAGVVGCGGAQDGPEAFAALEVQVPAQVPPLPVRELGDRQAPAFVALLRAVLQQAGQDRDDDLVQRPRQGAGCDGFGEPQQRVLQPLGLRPLERQQGLRAVDDGLQSGVVVVQPLQLTADQPRDVPHDRVQDQITREPVDEPLGTVQVRPAGP